MGVEFDFSELEEFAKKLENAEKKVETFVEDTNNEIALRLLRAVIQETDVGQYPKGQGVGGTLRGGWGADKVKINRTWINERHKIYIKNDVSYATYVEFGHRTREKKDGSRGFVPGKFHLTIAEGLTRDITPKLLRERTEKFLDTYLN